MNHASAFLRAGRRTLRLKLSDVGLRVTQSLEAEKDNDA
jgi:hypothetical protein